MRDQQSTSGRWRAGAAALAIVLVLGVLNGCSTRRAPKAIQMPAVNGLRTASDLLVQQVDARKGPPKWLDHARVQNGYIYGIGMETGGRDDSEALFRSMQAARRTILDFLDRREANTETKPTTDPIGIKIDPSRIEFEKLAFDTRDRRWYALARLDIEKQSQELEAEARKLSQRLNALHAKLVSPTDPSAGQWRAALGIAADFERLTRVEQLYAGLTGSPMEPIASREASQWVQAANQALAEHGIRIVVDGPPVAGLDQALNLVLGEFHLQTDEFGRGLITVHLHESKGFGPGNPYLEIDGSVEIALGGPGEVTDGANFNVVSTGDSLAEARFRAARLINEDVSEILRKTLESMAESAGS